MSGVADSGSKDDRSVKSSRITIAQLRAFVGVVERGGFGKAAAALGTTQPAISHAIASLERALGADLLNRQRRPLLTQYGQDLLPHARSAIASVDAFAMAAEHRRSQLSGQVRLAAPSTAYYGLLPRWLSRWKDSAPRIDVKVFEADDEELLEWLANGTVDAIVLVDPDQEWPGSLLVAQDAFEAVLRKDHPLAAEPRVELADLLDDPLIVRTGGCAGPVTEMCLRVKSDFSPTYEVREFGALIAMVANHLGVTIIPSLGRSLLTDELTMVPLRPQVQRSLYFTGPTDRPWSPLVTTLADVLKQDSPSAGAAPPADESPDGVPGAASRR
ncbi:LysR family transcriptional regulator [Micromonospora sp. CA-263727]|uniref:LysR family transcriptional regulator n=1 Tax=Micromonospora sp. CA-263727 TaxID=3239967 RepID=UPI003D8CDEC5